MAHRMLVYVPAMYWNPRASSDDTQWHRYVMAESRREALEKCLPELRELVATLPPATPELPTQRLSVFVGETHNPSAYANRLIPYQIDRTGKVVGSLGWDPRGQPIPRLTES